eukprot:CAMPEP_0172692388 /NCGR_PEP_ID=MMETSP1074-20121228/25218_1 /TAXON_ID=2916 /ORGANISM="Ceratium fusus, Strain PA161109" /LENGTH=79 /DNA_ID=CAMNT_0013512583 /DNA_START=219 /DNA_END=453 /DNA_ORIENTATION=-
MATLAEQKEEEEKEDHELQGRGPVKIAGTKRDGTAQSDDFSRQVSSAVGQTCSWKPQQTEDHLAFVVPQKRVQNTFITV